MLTRKNFQITLLVWVSFSLVLCFLALYKIWLAPNIEHHKLINELVTIKIDSIKVDTFFTTTIVRTYYAGQNRITVDRTTPEPYFKSKYSISIKNISGDLLLCYDSNFKYNFIWDSDLKKLELYLK